MRLARFVIPFRLPIMPVRGNLPNPMKSLAILLLLTAAVGADDLLPQSFAKDRYAATLAKSPFVLETKAVEPEAPKVNPFQNLYVSGIGSADGKDYVIIKRIGEDRALKPFVANEPGDDGLVVKLVRHGGSYRDTKVVLEKGPDTGEVGFKEDTINAPPPAPNAGRGPALPGQMMKPGAPMPMPVQVNAVRSQPAMPVQSIPRPSGSAMPMPTFKQPSTAPQPPGNMSVKGRGRPINK